MHFVHKEKQQLLTCTCFVFKYIHVYTNKTNKRLQQKQRSMWQDSCTLIDEVHTPVPGIANFPISVKQIALMASAQAQHHRATDGKQG